MFGPYHRPNYSADLIRLIIESGEFWGRPPRNSFKSDIPKVKAYDGPLPPGLTGFEFETEIPPDEGCVPGKPIWSGHPPRPGVIVAGEWAKIRVRILKQNVF